MTNVMTQAWTIAKQGQNKFGGKVSEYFAEALRIAWSIVKGLVKEEKQMKLVELQGTEKQVAWANSIREWTKRLLDEAIENGMKVPSAKPQFVDRLKAANEIIMSKDSARWWIDKFGNLVKPRDLERADEYKIWSEFEFAALSMQDIQELSDVRIGLELARRYYNGKYGGTI